MLKVAKNGKNVEKKLPILATEHSSYEEYNNEHQKDIMLWFYAGDTTHKLTEQKRSRSPLGNRKKPKHSNYQAKLDKVELILESLKKKHAGAYSEERL